MIVPLVNIGLWQVLCFLCLPVALVKTAISLVHLVAASQAMGELDVEERGKIMMPKHD